MTHHLHAKSLSTVVTSQPIRRSVRNNRFIKAAIATTTALTLAFTSQAALADKSHTHTEYARVVHVEPLYRYVKIKEPQRICRPVNHHRTYDRPRDYRPHNHHRSNRSHGRANGDVFVAGVIGGAIGHELSRSINGRPSAGATIAGAVIGSALASGSHASDHRPRYSEHNVSHRHNSRHNSDRHDYRHNNRQHCTRTVHTRTERKRDGYKVTYRYRGHQYHTRTRQHPGNRLPITVTIRPQRY